MNKSGSVRVGICKYLLVLNSSAMKNEICDIYILLKTIY